MLASFPKVPKTWRAKALKIENLNCQKLQSLRYIFAADSKGLSSFRCSWLAPKTHVFESWNSVRNGRSRSFKVINFGTNRKRVCYFLLVVNSNRFRDVATFLLKTQTPSLIHTNFEGVPIWLDYRCCISHERIPYANYSCNKFRTSPTYMPTVPQRYGQTDRRTDGRLTIAILRFARRASRGKNAALKLWKRLTDNVYRHTHETPHWAGDNQCCVAAIGLRKLWPTYIKRRSRTPIDTRVAKQWLGAWE